jgi:hypothetical protein
MSQPVLMVDFSLGHLYDLSLSQRDIISKHFFRTVS